MLGHLDCTIREIWKGHVYYYDEMKKEAMLKSEFTEKSLVQYFFEIHLKILAALPLQCKYFHEINFFVKMKEKRQHNWKGTKDLLKTSKRSASFTSR
ncbi:hypothetical protein Bhyg_07811, partial [Pseudolycoriella hygida]